MNSEEGLDIQKLMKTLQNSKDQDKTDNHLTETLNALFAAKSFAGFNKSIFDMIDEMIGEITKEAPTTFATEQNLVDAFKNETTRTRTVATVNNLLSIILEQDLSSASEDVLLVFGDVLEILRVDALNATEKNSTGTKDGVFNNVFATVIWYLTNQDITADHIFAGKTSSLKFGDATADDVYKILKSDVEEKGGFYYYNTFPAKMKEVKEGLEIAQAFSNALGGIDINNNLQGFVEALQGVLNDYGTIENQLEKLDTLTDILSSTGKSLLSQEDYEANKDKLEMAINGVYADKEDDSEETKAQNAQMRAKLKALFETNMAIED